MIYKYEFSSIIFTQIDCLRAIDMKCIRPIVVISLFFYSTANAAAFHEATQLGNDKRCYSVIHTNFPDDQIIDAMDCLDKAYLLHPDDTDLRIRSFSGFMDKSHKANRGWSVAQGCGALFVPQLVDYLTLGVSEDSCQSNTTTSYSVTIFN